MKPYTPVSDDFKEELEDLIVLKKNCTLKFEGDNGGIAMIQARLRNIYSQEGEEFLQTDSGLAIRLDKIVEINGKPSENYC